MQTTATITNGPQIQNAWAFAADKNRIRGVRRARVTQFSNCVITACSREAKSLGIRVGMKYSEAKRRVPTLRVLVIGDRRYGKR